MRNWPLWGCWQLFSLLLPFSLKLNSWSLDSQSNKCYTTLYKCPCHMLQSSVVYGWTSGLITRLYNVKDFCFHNITHRLKNTVKWMNSVPDHVLYCYYFTIFNVILITQPSLQQTIKRKNTLYVHIFKVGKLYWVNAWIGREIDGLLSKCTSLLGSHFKGCQVTLRSSSVGRYSGGSVSSLSPILISFSSAIVFSCNNKANQNSWSGMQIFYYYFKLFLLFF